MGVAISAIGKGSPGEKGIPGDTFTNKELLNHLKKGFSFWQRVGLKINPKKVERSLSVFEKISGIKRRQLLISNSKFPNESLATAACLDAIKDMKSKDPSFSPEKIDGFISVTDTAGTIFPIYGKIILKSLDIKPKYFANTSLACSSITNAIQQACLWMEFDPECKYVLISACDITSRLHQSSAKKQPFLFGDQAVAMILERTNKKGGFIFSNLYVDPNAPDILHIPSYSGDTSYCKRNFSEGDFRNDENLKQFGEYESRAIGGLYSIYMQKNNALGERSISAKDGLRTTVEDGEIFIPPQVAKRIAQNAAENTGLDCKELEENTIESTVPNYAITGAAGTPLALYNLSRRRDLSNTRFTSFICAIGGINAIMTYDPKNNRSISFNYRIDENTLGLGDSDSCYTENFDDNSGSRIKAYDNIDLKVATSDVSTTLKTFISFL